MFLLKYSFDHWQDAGLVGKQIKDGVKLLGAGASSFSIPMHLEVSLVDKSTFPFSFVLIPK